MAISFLVDWSNIMGTVFSLNDLTLGYERHPAVHHITGNFLLGSMTAIVGPNGAGKSTLLKGLMGLIKPLDGQINYHKVLPTEIAYLPQQADIDRSFPISVMETVLIGHWKKIGLFRAVTNEMKREAEIALEAVGLTGFENRVIESLSAGQFQRVLFARMLLQDAQIILLDEPFTAIDAKTTTDLLKVVFRWHTEKRTVIAVLHDMDQVKNNFPETLLISREPIAWGPTNEVLVDKNILKARQMVETWDEHSIIYNQDVT